MCSALLPSVYFFIPHLRNSNQLDIWIYFHHTLIFFS
nr:MAG TPA: hypothetical protein [Bacteriophage sp.]